MSATPQHTSGTGQRHWSSIGEETFVGGMWLLYGLFRVGGRLPFRLVLYPVVLWYWAANRGARTSMPNASRVCIFVMSQLSRPSRKCDSPSCG